MCPKEKDKGRREAKNNLRAYYVPGINEKEKNQVQQVFTPQGQEEKHDRPFPRSRHGYRNWGLS
jgi:hypothetical protein